MGAYYKTCLFQPASPHWPHTTFAYKHTHPSSWRVAPLLFLMVAQQIVRYLSWFPVLCFYCGYRLWSAKLIWTVPIFLLGVWHIVGTLCICWVEFYSSGSQGDTLLDAVINWWLATQIYHLVLLPETRLLGRSVIPLLTGGLVYSGDNMSFSSNELAVFHDVPGPQICARLLKAISFYSI